MIETERLILRRWTLQNASKVHHIYGDPETMRLFANGQTFTPEELDASFAGVLQEYVETGLGNFAVVERSTCAIIGHCGIHLSKEPEVDVEADWLIAKGRWNRGYATEAATAVVGSAFALHGFARVGGVAHRENNASIAVMRKLNMTPIRDLIRFEMPSVLYGVTGDAFRSRAST